VLAWGNSHTLQAGSFSASLRTAFFITGLLPGIPNLSHPDILILV
jgi:hypothetical protein